MRWREFFYDREKLFLTILLLLILFLIRLVIFSSSYEKISAGQYVDLEHTFLSPPYENDFYQYFYTRGALITLESHPKYDYGDKILIRGRAKEVTISRNGELLKQTVIKKPKVKISQSENIALAVVRDVRQKVLSAYRSVLPQKESGLLSGIVLGVEDDINREFREELKQTGMLHVVVASGSNVVLVAGVVFGLLSGTVKRRLAVLFTILAIVFYALIAGFDSPIIRAGIMASFAILGQLFGRQKTAIISLIFSAWIMLMVSPLLLMDIGFQLSFSATGGIIIFHSVIGRLVKILPTILKEDFSTTLAAQMGSLPFLLFAFGKINLLSLLINLMLLWTIPMLMFLGGAAGVIALVSPIIATPLLLISYPLLLFFSNVVSFSSSFSVPISLTGAAFPIALIYYILLIFYLLKRRAKS